MTIFINDVKASREDLIKLRSDLLLGLVKIIKCMTVHEDLYIYTT